MKFVRAILIDPVNRSINAITHDTSDYRNINTTIHADDCFTTVNLLQPGDAVYVGDSGRINGNGEKIGGFRLLGDPDKSLGYDLAGYGLVLGSNEEGFTEDAKTTVAWLLDHIEWREPQWFADNPAPPMQFVPLDI